MFVRSECYKAWWCMACFSFEWLILFTLSAGKHLLQWWTASVWGGLSGLSAGRRASCWNSGSVIHHLFLRTNCTRGISHFYHLLSHHGKISISNAFGNELNAFTGYVNESECGSNHFFFLFLTCDIDFLRGQFDSKNYCNWIDGLIGLKRLYVNTSINLTQKLSCQPQYT